MVEKQAPEWRIHAVAGSLLLLDVLTIGLAPAGPWDSNSFTLGVMGMTGLCLCYVAWYRATFSRKGLVPWLDQWQNPSDSSRKVLATGLVCLLAAWVAGNSMQEHLPDPSGLVLMLIGLLISLSGLYVMLSIGPLAD